jgi:hypothetical protein
VAVVVTVLVVMVAGVLVVVVAMVHRGVTVDRDAMLVALVALLVAVAVVLVVWSTTVLDLMATFGL